MLKASATVSESQSVLASICLNAYIQVNKACAFYNKAFLQSIAEHQAIKSASKQLQKGKRKGRGKGKGGRKVHMPTYQEQLASAVGKGNKHKVKGHKKKTKHKKKVHHSEAIAAKKREKAKKRKDARLKKLRGEGLA